MTNIKGTIDYEITKDEKGNWGISYLQTPENDIASLAIALTVADLHQEYFKKGKKEAKTKKLKDAFGTMISRAAILSREAKGLFNHSIRMYIEYKGHQKLAADLESHVTENVTESKEEETSQNL